MKVKDLYKDLDLVSLQETANGGDTYCVSVYQFVSQVWDRDIETLTKKQVNWLERISEQESE